MRMSAPKDVVDIEDNKLVNNISYTKIQILGSYIACEPCFVRCFGFTFELEAMIKLKRA